MAFSLQNIIAHYRYGKRRAFLILACCVKACHFVPQRFFCPSKLAQRPRRNHLVARYIETGMARTYLQPHYGNGVPAMFIS